MAWLVAKEWRELVASRAWWVLLLATGPLAGVAFISAVRTYAELSGAAAGVGEAFSPLIGVWAPTFSAFELAAVFLLPFVAIRLVGGDRQTGVLKLEMQQRLPAWTRIGVKAAILMLGWLIASLPAAIAIGLWRAYGGTLHMPELVASLGGHILNAGITIGFAAAMSAVSEHPSTAAILTLSATVGTWIVDFIAAIHGGTWERLAGYMPAAMVSELQHGLVRLPVILIAITVIALELSIAAIWIRFGVTVRRRALETAAACAVAAAVIGLGVNTRANWDVSEQRMNSFARADEALLARLPQPLAIEVHLAPEDPRRVDLERGVLSKLRRAVPSLAIDYVSYSSTGLFEQAREDYGEIWYALGGRRVMSRSTAPEAVLDTIYQLAGIVQPPARAAPDEFRGHPLASPPRGAALVFYGIWPACVLAAMGFARWRHG